MSQTTTGLFSLEGKVIVVTGGTGILGTSFVNGILDAGGKVAILNTNEEKGAKAVAALKARGGDAIAIASSVLDEDKMAIARDKILEKYGKIDGLVIAAGGNVPEGVLKPEQDVFDLNIEGMKKALELNLWGTIIPTQILGPELAKTGNGSVVNISSVSSKRAITRVLGYSMGKSAIDCYTKWFALEMANRYGDAIRMNSIMPGFFLTEQNRALLTNLDGSLTARGNLIINQTPFKRFGHPDELIGALIWLLSDASKFVTGTDIGVDGGFTMNSGV